MACAPDGLEVAVRCGSGWVDAVSIRGRRACGQGDAMLVWL